jgi:hypothetical protein
MANPIGPPADAVNGVVRWPSATAPAWSMIAVGAGGLASIQLVPTTGFGAPGGLFPAALVLTLGLLLGSAVAVVRSPMALFRLEHILSIGLCYWLALDLLLGQDHLGVAGRGATVAAFAAITLFALAMWIGSVFVSAFKGSSSTRAPPRLSDLSTRFIFGAALISAILGMSRVLVGCSFSPACVIEAFYHPRFSAVWFRVDAFGHFDTLFLYSRYFGFLVLPLSVALVVREGRLTWRSITTLLMGLVCLVFMIGDGGRKDVGTVVGASLLVWGLMGRRLALRHLFGMAALAGCFVFLMQFMLIARDIGLAAALDRGFTLGDRSRPIGIVDRNMRFLASIIELVPERLPYSGWQGVAYSTMGWIPGGLVPRAWQHRSIDLPAELGMVVGPKYTWTCSAIGDLYLIGGFPVVIAGGLLFGVLARSASRLMEGATDTRRPILYALGAMTLFLSLRALHELFVTGFIVLAFAAFLVLRRLIRRPGRRTLLEHAS